MPLRFSNTEGLARLQSFADRHGGSILSTAYETLEGRYLCRCATGHEWTARGSSITQGRWCPECSHARKRSGIEEFRSQIEAQGGTLLEEEYRGSLALHMVRCAAGHEWETTPNRVQRGAWCPVCYRERRKG